MDSKNKSWLSLLLGSLFGLCALTFGVASYRCERASWRHKDGQWEAGPDGITHGQALKSLNAAEKGLEAAAAIFLASSVFITARHFNRVHASVSAFVGGLACFALLFWLGLSILENIPEQRRCAGIFIALMIASLGCFLASSIFGLSSKRLAGIAMGIISLLVCVVILTS